MLFKVIDSHKNPEESEMKMKDLVKAENGLHLTSPYTPPTGFPKISFKIKIFYIVARKCMFYYSAQRVVFSKLSQDFSPPKFHCLPNNLDV